MLLLTVSKEKKYVRLINLIEANTPGWRKVEKALMRAFACLAYLFVQILHFHHFFITQGQEENNMSIM